MKLRTTLTALVLSYAILTTACASNFATDLRLALTIGDAFIPSLHLGPKATAVEHDFVVLGGGAATMADSFSTCAGNKVCDLAAVKVFDGAFEQVVASGDFGLNPKLQTVEDLVRGIINAAEVYYGAKPVAGVHTAMQADPLTTIKMNTAALKALTHPK